MRPHSAIVLALLTGLAAAQAHAQSRYGPASPIPPAPTPAAGAIGESLNWPGKAVIEAAQTPQGQHPQPLSSWAQRQAALTPGPAVAALPPSPSTPRPIAGSPTLRGAPAPAAPEAPAQTPAAAPVPQPAPAASPPAPAPAARVYPGYGVPQLQTYPGYVPPAQPATQTGLQAAPASGARTATLAPPAAQAGAHIYSVGREFGQQPDLIAARPPSTGAEMILDETPSTRSLAGHDEPEEQPRRRQSEEADRP